MVIVTELGRLLNIHIHGSPVGMTEQVIPNSHALWLSRTITRKRIFLPSSRFVRGTRSSHLKLHSQAASSIFVSEIPSGRKINVAYFHTKKRIVVTGSIPKFYAWSIIDLCESRIELDNKESFYHAPISLCILHLKCNEEKY